MLPTIEPLTTKNLVKASFYGYAVSFSKILWVLMSYIGFVLVTSSIHIYLLWSLETNLTHHFHSHWFTFATIWTIVLLAFVHTFMSVWFHLLLFIRVNAVLNHSLIPKSLLLETSLRQFLPYFASSVVLFLMIVFGLLLCVLPGMFIWLSFILVKPIIATENLKLVAAFSRSVELVKYHYRHVFAAGFLVMLVGSVMVFFMIGSVGVVFFLLEQLIHQGSLHKSCLFIGLFVLTYAGFALLLPLYYSYLSILMQDLKLRLNKKGS